ncbi:MAG TPA: sugar phosphate isomerase/epimerase family protein [Candidatus Bathyarchaeia archaeon]|nr:sugar phosphate isomerase/epimerase family protein [Candidatus Bathyarchaeia archaeon]
MFKPKIGVSMLHTLGEPFNVMLKQLAKVETEYVEIVDDGFHTLNKQRVKALNEIAQSHGFKYTFHCPFADINIASPSKPMLNASLKRLKQSMAYARQLNAELWVLHPGLITGITSFYPGSDWKQNVHSIRALHEPAKEYGLRIAIENLPQKYGSIMKTPEDFKRLYAETGLTDIGIVLDTGHANLEAQTEPFLTQLPDKIYELHLSDNMGEQDQHLGIGYGKINWQRLAQSLKHISFAGTVMVESVYNVPESLTKLRQLLA